MPLQRTPSLVALPALLVSLALTSGADAANGDLLATHTVLAGKNISCICQDSTDGSYWAVGETTGKIYHLGPTFTALPEIVNPHGTGVFPNLVLTRGIAFRQSSQTLLVMAKDSGVFRVKEVNRTGGEVPGTGFQIDLSAFSNVNLYGLAYDPMNDHVWVLDDYNDQIIRVTMTGTPVKDFPIPQDIPRETTLRGTGISFRQEGATPYLYVTFGDILTLAPSKIMEVTITGFPTGFEIPLAKVPPETAGEPLREVGSLLAATIGGRDAALVVGRQGVMHVLEKTRSAPLPPSFFRGRITLTNQVILKWLNHGSGVGGSYPGGHSISRNGLPLMSISGTRTEFTDEDPPSDQVVTYTIKSSNGGAFSVPVETKVLVGKGGLLGWVPFPGQELYDIARDSKNGDYYVTDSVGGKIFHYDASFQLLGEMGSPFAKPGGIAYNPDGNGGAGSLLVAMTDGVLVREIDLQGSPLDLQTPVELAGVSDTPRIAGLTYDPASALFTCMEATSRQLVSFDRNGRRRAVCTPRDIFTDTRANEGVAFDTLTGNFHITFEDLSVRETFTNCTLTGFSFELSALGETAVDASFVRGIEISENTLLVCSPQNRAIFQVLIFPQGGSFIRGDLDRDGEVRLTDAVVVAEYLFKSGPVPFCLDAADTNDDGELDISDPVYLLFYLFLGGQAPPQPFPAAGTDPTYIDDLEC